MNPLFNAERKGLPLELYLKKINDMGISMDDWKPFLDLMDDNIQNYLRDACRVFRLKVY
eukprot:CAMPEP_0170566724 /NCGR_PEP_ID=MMETSP0211-20121228/80022_1 /TAXON_ID=311385 /ORGANISM="Pseudokeronopsis sp., Strain OXSARD2" /LENGTH=58 /DNA_ID=CAMNT_0010887977 /DNA_START=264 /DNA_END=440 /DNA_ORIENTATION=-